MINIVDYIKDDSDINVHGHVTLDKEAAKHISNGLNTIGSQIGLGASIVGIGSAVGKVIAKSSMPPLQKAGIIIGSGLITGFGHSIISNINRNSVTEEYIKNNTNIVDNHVNNVNSNISKLVDDTISSSPLENLLFDIEGISYTCLSLVIILAIQILFKFYMKENTSLKLSNILGKSFNDKLEYYLNKIIVLNKKMSNIYIVFIIILLITGLSFSAYASGELYNNINHYILVHNSFNK
jgi:hypothetical protein